MKSRLCSYISPRKVRRKFQPHQCLREARLLWVLVLSQASPFLMGTQYLAREDTKDVHMSAPTLSDRVAQKLSEGMGSKSPGPLGEPLGVLVLDSSERR